MVKVLVADDDKSYRSLIKEALESAGYEVLLAFDGKEALEKLSENPDIAVLDVNMPGKNGFEVCREIRNDPGRRSMPVLILTVLSEVSDQVKGYDMGADEYVPKPFSIEVFLARMKKLERLLG